MILIHKSDMSGLKYFSEKKNAKGILDFPSYQLIRDCTFPKSAKLTFVVIF